MFKSAKVMMVVVLTFFSQNLYAHQHEISTFNYPPFLHEENNDQSLMTEIVKAALDEVEYDIPIKFYPITRSIVLTREGRVPAHLGSLLNFENKEGLRAVTLCYGRGMIYKLSKNKDINFKKFADLKSYTIGTLRGGLENQVLESMGVEAHPLNDIERGFTMLKYGRIDLVTTIDLTGNIILTKQFPKNINYVHMFSKPLIVFPMDLVVNLDNPYANEIADAVERGLFEIIKNGKYIQILERYYGVGKVPEEVKISLE